MLNCISRTYMNAFAIKIESQSNFEKFHQKSSNALYTDHLKAPIHQKNFHNILNFMGYKHCRNLHGSLKKIYLYMSINRDNFITKSLILIQTYDIQGKMRCCIINACVEYVKKLYSTIQLTFYSKKFAHFIWKQRKILIVQPFDKSIKVDVLRIFGHYFCRWESMFIFYEYKRITIFTVVKSLFVTYIISF